MSDIDALLRDLKKYGTAGRDCALSAEDALAIVAALEAAREYVAEADRRVGEQFNKAQRSEAYALEKAAETLTLTKELEAAREDVRHLEPWRDAVFDGASVFAAMNRSAKARTSPENVSDALDAVANVARAAIDQARGKAGGEVEGG